MPSNSSNTSETYVPKTDYAYTAPYGGMKGFMDSYGLKMYNHDDVQEAKSIIQGFREQDKYEWEQNQKEQQQRK